MSTAIDEFTEALDDLLTRACALENNLRASGNIDAIKLRLRLSEVTTQLGAAFCELKEASHA